MKPSTVPNPQDVPPLAVRAFRGSATVLPLLATVRKELFRRRGELVHLLHDAEVPVGVIFED